MVCIFCIAVMVLVAGALTAEHLEDVEARLAERAVGGEVKRTVDSESVAKYELTVKIGDKSAPVTVTIFKDSKRVRIQILTHDLTKEEVEQLEDELAEALGAKIVDRTDPVHEASAEHAAEHAAKDKAEAEAAERERDKKEKGKERVEAPPKDRPKRG